MLYILDFDKTLVDIHTQNNWNLTIEQLTEHVRPIFLSLINKWINRGNDVAIATYSKQVKLIQKVLKHFFPNHTFVVCGGMPKKFGYGKNGHIKKICDRLKKDKNEVLFIDDDANNVRIASNECINSIHFVEDNNNLLAELEAKTHFF